MIHFNGRLFTGQSRNPSLATPMRGTSFHAVSYLTRVDEDPSGGDFLVEAEVLFDRWDANFELFTFVEFVLLEFGELGVEAIYFCAVVGLHAVDLGGSLSMRLSNRAMSSARAANLIVGRCRGFGNETCEGFKSCLLCGHMRGVYHTGRGLSTHSSSGPAICSTRLTIARRTFGSGICMKALVRWTPSDVAR
jgi:hypothetical protein